MVPLFMTLNPLTKLCLSRSDMEEAIKVYPLSIISTLLPRKLPVDGGSVAPGLIQNSTFNLLVLPLLPSFASLQRLGVVICALPTKEEVAEAPTLVLDTVILPTTSPVPLTLSRGAIVFRSFRFPFDDKAVCFPTRDLFTRSCIYLAVLGLFLVLSGVAT